MAGQNQQPPSAPPEFTPADNEARRAITGELDDTLFVEASAGTGKTTSLVRRIVNLVVCGKTTMDRIAAITFTELAAAELRDRVREELEKTASDASRPEDEQARCRQGVEDLDQANIRTLHSFAGQLLHERPLEAGLPPGFETSDEIVAGLAFDDAWEKWLDWVLEIDSPIAGSLSLLLTQGITLGQLKKLAGEFHGNYADLSEPGPMPPAPPLGAAAVALVQRWPEAERLLDYSKIGAGDPLYDHVSLRGLAVQSLGHAPADSLNYYRQLARLLPLRMTRGRQGDWGTDPATGKNACAALKDLLNDLQQEITAELEDARRHALTEIVASLTEFVLEYARQRKQDGRAEFQDLLVWARDLLRDDITVRDYFRRRFSHLLIDESQDTDPIQAEIAMFLAEAVPPDVPEGERPTAWDAVVPERGKLFVVGDPKQSIYRFRRADVEQMIHLRDRMEAGGGRTVNLSQNFRSQEPVVAWVNHLFENWMAQGDAGESAEQVQAEYVPMFPRWSAATASSVGPRVWALADEAQPGLIGAVRQQEATDIAALLRQIVQEGWLKLDRTATDAAGGREVYAPAGYSDICLLIRARSYLSELERALNAANVPYRLESASLIFDSQEVRDLLNCLRAIDNPADRVATVAALRSPAFGCSDVDLLRHYEGGGQFDYLSDAGGRGEPVVVEGQKVLESFHRRRLWESPANLIERFVRDRMLLEGAASHPRMREQWRRYRFMVERAAQYAEAGGKSLRSFVGWVDDQILERVRVTETPVPDSDEESVRIMTMHSAKGLEFPVVILTGLNTADRFRPTTSLFDRSRGSVEVGFGSQNTRLCTDGYEELRSKEERMSAAENVRLAYVAATRARDHLVLSLRRKEGENSAAHTISQYMADHPELWEPVALKAASMTTSDEPPEEDTAPGSVASGPEHSVAARDAWVAGRQELIARSSRPSFTSATALGQRERQERERKDEPEWGQADEPWRRGRAGTQVGRAVHAVLQSIDLATGHGVEERARAQATAEGIPHREGDVLRLARVAIDSPIVRRAVASQRFWREVPVAAPVEGGFLHGFIDLLFEEPDGLVVVDYKTDSVANDKVEDAMKKYRLQGGAYACAVAKATGKPVKEVRFLYLEAEEDVPLPDLAMAMRDAELTAAAELSVPGISR